MNHMIQQCVIDNPSNVLLRDAVITALGVGHQSLGSRLNFIQLFSQCFVNDTAAGGGGQGMATWVLRARVAWLIGQWSSAIAPQYHVLFYPVLLGLLKSEASEAHRRHDDPMLVVRLHAAVSLKALVSHVQHDAAVMAALGPHAVPFTQSLIALYLDVSHHKQLIVDVLESVLDTMIAASASNSSHVLLSSLVGAISEMWSHASGNTILQRSICGLYRRAVNAYDAVGKATPAVDVDTVALGMAAVCTNKHHVDSLVLMEEGMLLWLALLRRAGSISPALFSAFPNLCHMMLDRDFEGLSLAYHVLLEYVLVGGKDFLQSGLTQIMVLFEAHLATGVLKTSTEIIALDVYDNLLLMDTGAISKHSHPIAVRLVNQMMQSVNTTMETSTPHYLSQLCRFSVLCPDLFTQALTASGVPLRTFISASVRTFDFLGTWFQRKTLSWMMCYLFPIVVQAGADIAFLCWDMLGLVGAILDEQSEVTSVHQHHINRRVSGGVTSENQEYTTADEEGALMPDCSPRRTQLIASSDPVLHTPLMNVLKDALARVRQMLPPEVFQKDVIETLMPLVEPHNRPAIQTAFQTA